MRECEREGSFSWKAICRRAEGIFHAAAAAAGTDVTVGTLVKAGVVVLHTPRISCGDMVNV